MVSILVRYGVAVLAGALAALNATEARGGWWSHCCGACNPCRGVPLDLNPHLVPLATPPVRPEFPSPGYVVARPPVLPPPGTLGWTYRQLSRPIPESEHPRTAMLEVCGVPPNLHATVNGMDGYRGTDGVWYFKTIRPLIPGVPFIKTVRVHPPHVDPQRCADYRVLRLIPDRVVYLRW